MPVAAVEKREFKVGTTGWTVESLDNRRVERLWEQGRYEIVEGVLTEMAAAYHDSGRTVFRLGTMIQNWLDLNAMGGGISNETDLVLNERRIPKVDLIYLTENQEREQKKRSRQRGRPGVQFGRIVVAPEMVLESISIGHEDHDLVVKRAWYAEFGIKHYWLLNAYKRSLQCMVLEEKDYRIDQAGKVSAKLRPSLFPGMIIPLANLWK